MERKFFFYLYQSGRALSSKLHWKLGLRALIMLHNFSWKAGNEIKVIEVKVLMGLPLNKYKELVQEE